MIDALAAVVDVRLRPPRQGDGDHGHGLLLDGPGYDRWASLLSTGAALPRPGPLVALPCQQATRGPLWIRLATRPLPCRGPAPALPSLFPDACDGNSP